MEETEETEDGEEAMTLGWAPVVGTEIANEDAIGGDIDVCKPDVEEEEEAEEVAEEGITVEMLG